MPKPIFALLGLLLLLVLAACEDPGPTATPVPPALTATPSASPTNTGTVTPVPTSTVTPTSTTIPTATPTEGAVRTPVGGAAGHEFEDSLATMAAVGSYRYDLSMLVGPAEATYVLTGTGEFKATDSYHTTYHALQFQTELINIGTEPYFRVNNGLWRFGDIPHDLFPLGPPPPVGDLLALITYSVDASLVGQEDVAGTPARHFRYLLRPDVVPGIAGPYDGLAGGDLWVDAATHRFLRLDMVLDPANGFEKNHATISITFRDYNAPVTIRRPQ